MWVSVFLLSFFTLTSSRLIVWSNQEVVDSLGSREIPYTLANYGYIPYGSSLFGYLHLANPDTACTEMEPIQPYGANAADLTKILLVRRGDCTFVQKTYHAQQAGASMVIIYDNVQEDLNMVLIADTSGLSESIQIPTVGIQKEQGTKLSQALTNTNATLSQTITVEIQFLLSTQSK
jgi:PA domain